MGQPCSPDSPGLVDTRCRVIREVRITVDHTVSLMVGFLGLGLVRRVRVYEVFVEGAKDGFRVAVRIIPYLVAILVAVDMLRASGVMNDVVGAIGGITGSFGLPAEALPMALMRPLSGSGAYGILGLAQK